MEFSNQRLLVPEIPPRAFEACYIDEAHPSFCCVPFVDALMPTFNAAQLKESFNKTNYRQASVGDSDIERKRCVYSLKDEYTVLVPEFQDVYDKIDLAIKSGYLSREDTLYNYEQQRQNLHYAMSNDTVPWRDLSVPRPVRNVTSIIGCKGSGKTLVMQQCLSMYPRVIWHDKQSEQVQIVYLSVNLKGATSPIEYCSIFLQSLENAIGKQKYASEVVVSPNLRAALLKIRSLLITYNVGLVVIDSLQVIEKWKYDERNIFLEHIDGLGDLVPLLLISNSNAIYELSDISQSNIDWDPLMRFSGKDDLIVERWSLFSKKLWKRNCLKNQSPELSAELSSEWFDACEGVIGLAVHFFVACQIEAINSGVEQITVSLMKDVRRKEFRLKEGFLSAIKSDKNKIFERLVNSQEKGKVKPKNNKSNQSLAKPKNPEKLQRNDFKRVSKKDWSKLPLDDLRYLFSQDKSGSFYHVLKNEKLILSMSDLINYVELPCAVPR